MTESELQEEAGILNLACGQLGNALLQFRLQGAVEVYQQLGIIIKKAQKLEEMKNKKETEPSDDKR